ncbi:glycosyltransferase [Moorena producens]|uniref:glycosyltransferase n=1 Tax=Moorena producens TaxID=1155739 RepID=UPI003C7457DC
MRVIHLPFCFHPDPVGGTEVYVEALCHHLQDKGVEVVIASPGKTNQTYIHNQLQVHRFALSQFTNIRTIYGEGDELASVEFSHILDREKPDLVHFHAFTPGVSIRLVQAAKQRQIPVVFTYHTPTVSCQRGTLMQWGSKICDGKLDLHTCAKCELQGLGLHRSMAGAIGSLPPQMGKWLGDLNLQGGAWTALRMTELVSLRHSALNSLLAEVDHIVAVCNWVRDVLLLNQVPSAKISVIRQGLCHDDIHNIVKPENFSEQPSTQTLKIAFLGRIDPTKGIHILIEALQRIPLLPISLDIYGVSQGIASDSYQEKLHKTSQNDPRIQFKPSIPAAQVIATLREYDLLAVPSQWLETGPMVVMEAFAAGIPVIGSRLGGIAELVQDGVNGILVEPTSVEAWAEKICDLCGDRSQLTHLRSGISPPQDMQTVAKQMRLIYQAAIAKLSYQNS